MILNADDFENWRNGDQARVFYQSGKITVGDIDVSLSQPGTYYIAFNNKFSLFSDKSISSNITIQH